ncbi:hypothetical protein ACO0LC_10900 [Undibacterium sp. JH2W]|uniref:hypothetical protein n=1 Tax=Undibacterium sp. JH2W TaxID=3413037 RepID=UPI003BF381DB
MELIAILSDSQRFLNSTSYRLADLATLHNMCMKTNAVTMSYALFDMKSYVKKGDDQALVVQQVGKLMYKNVVSFQNELEPLQPFLVRCLAKEIPLLTEFIATLQPEEFTDIRRGGLQQARNGVLSIYYGNLQILSNPDLKKPFKEKIVEALADAAAPLASIIQPAARQQIWDLATTIQKTRSGTMDSNLRKIIEVMSATECVGLCKL